MKSKGGFTLVELMVSLAVMTVGTASIFALQGYVARSNLHSKEITIATSIAENWVERLKMDALNWTQPAPEGTPGINLSFTQYLIGINTATDWTVPSNGYSSTLEYSPGADIHGLDILNWPPSGSVGINYCTNFRYAWVEPGSAMRVDIRVFWPKRPSAANISVDAPLCVTVAANLPNYHTVYTSTIVRYTTPKQ